MAANFISTPGRIGPFNQTVTGSQVIVNYPQASYDWRVRISLAPNSTYFYNDSTNSLLAPLVNEASNTWTNTTGVNNQSSPTGQTRVGVVFPYTPTVSVTHTANYTKQPLTHSNYANYFYDYSEVNDITINAEFTVQNVQEGQYLLASIYFFRSVTKMFFGNDTSPAAGNPPPLVYLNGYGQYYLPNVPCVVKSFQHTMPDNVDYMDIIDPTLGSINPYTTASSSIAEFSTRLPTTSNVILTLQPIYSRLSQSQFSLNDFARGALINKGGAGLPATAGGASVTPTQNGAPGTGGFF